MSEDKKTIFTAPVVLKSIWYGFIAGMISGMVKIGWENIFPAAHPGTQRHQPAAAHGPAAGLPRRPDLQHGLL